MSEARRIWVLIGERTGDNGQVLALAEEVGLPFETRTLHYNMLRGLGGRVLGASSMSLRRSARRYLNPPWPDLIIAVGRRAVPVARYIKRNNGGNTQLVLVGNPRIEPSLFDLVITTRQYPVPQMDNVVELPVAMSRFSAPPVIDSDEADRLAALPRPHLLFALGGATKYWRFTAAAAGRAARRLAERAEQRGGSLIIVGSRRTPPEVLRKISAAIERSRHRLVDGQRPRFGVLLADADEIFVTADSVSMLSEAILFGKPVGIVPISLDAKGRRRLGPGDRANQGTRRRDLRRFWNHLLDQKLAGTIDQPIAAQIENPVKLAARAVRALLNR